MLAAVLLSLVIIAITILIHGFGTTYLVTYLYRKQWSHEQESSMRNALFVLSATAVALMILHFAEITLWASVYLIFPIQEITDMEQAVYFSMITYTTVGYGDVVLGPHWRIMSGFEAMNGILLFGWSTAIFFSTFQRILGNLKNRFEN